MEPHDPYRPPTDFERRFSHHSADPTDGDPDVIAHRVYELEERVERHEIEPLVDRYDDEIAYFDQSFDELIRLLEGLDLMDSTVLVVASDHGEDFLEHGHVKHCRTLFDTSIRTPLILHMPGVRHRKVGVAVANLDVVATLLDLLRISSPEGLEGESLLAIAESDAYETRYVHSHQGRWRSVATSDAKIIADLVKSTVTYYDLRTDPGELTGTSDRAELPAELVRELRLRLDVEEQIVGRAGAVGAARRAAEHLRDLGYLE
jgi:arylsulfatase A-like enzyme